MDCVKLRSTLVRNFSQSLLLSVPMMNCMRRRLHGAKLASVGEVSKVATNSYIDRCFCRQQKNFISFIVQYLLRFQVLGEFGHN